MIKNLQASVTEGYQVASGNSTTDKRFPDGTIKMQIPFFKKEGFDFNEYFENSFIYGTLNLEIKNYSVHIAKPEYFFKNIMWTDLLPAENFYLSKAKLLYKNKFYKAIIYIPDPSTKVDHFQKSSTIEIIAEKITDINYGDKVILVYDDNAIQFIPD